MHNTELQMTIGVVSFESATEIYNIIFPSLKPMHKRRLEDGWFVYKILNFKTEFNPWPRNKNSELDIENLCHDVYEFIRRKIDEKWLHHICSELAAKNAL